MKGFLQILMIAVGMSYALAASLPEEKTPGNVKEAVLAGGNFRYTQAIFESIIGVRTVTAGYAPGNSADPIYATPGPDRRVQAVRISYDTTLLSYTDLLKVYVESLQDPAQADGQGADRGPQYRTFIYYRTEAEKKEAEDYLDKVNRSGRYKGTTAMQLLPLTKFYPAEKDNQDYISRHATDDYTQTVALPLIRKFQLEHPRLIKADKKLP